MASLYNHTLRAPVDTASETSFDSACTNTSVSEDANDHFNNTDSLVDAATFNLNNNNNNNNNHNNNNNNNLDKAGPSVSLSAACATTSGGMAGRSRSMSQQATSGRTRTASQASAVEDGVFSAFASARRRATSNATAVESPPSNTLGATLAVDSGVAGEGGAAGAAGRRSRAASQATAVEATAPYSPRASEGGCDSRPASRGAGPAESSSRSRTSSIAPSIDGVSVGAAGGSALLMSMADSRRDSSASRTSGLGASGGLGGLGGGGGGGGVLVSGVAVGSLKSRDSMQSMPYSTVSEGDESNTQEDPRGERDSVYSADSNDEVCLYFLFLFFFWMNVFVFV